MSPSHLPGTEHVGGRWGGECPQAKGRRYRACPLWPSCPCTLCSSPRPPAPASFLCSVDVPSCLTAGLSTSGETHLKPAPSPLAFPAAFFQLSCFPSGKLSALQCQPLPGAPRSFPSAVWGLYGTVLSALCSLVCVSLWL